jgi:hypothetical protein
MDPGTNPRRKHFCRLISRGFSTTGFGTVFVMGGGIFIVSLTGLMGRQFSPRTFNSRRAAFASAFEPVSMTLQSRDVSKFLK